jgi:hypothetical protein
MRSSKGRERKVIRAKDAATDADPATEDPIPRACHSPWGTPGHATNRHCPLGPAPAPVTSPPSVEWKEPSGSAESVCVSKLESIRRMPPPPPKGTHRAVELEV